MSSRNEDNYGYSKIPKKLKSIKKRTFKAKPIYKTLSNKNIFNIKSYLLNIKYFFIKIISRKNNHNKK